MSDTLLPYPTYKESGVDWLGDVPEHWEIRRLKRVCSLIYGDSLPDANRVEGDVPVFGSNGRVGWHDVANTHEPAIIIGRKGSFGKVNYSPYPSFAIDTTFYVDGRYTQNDLRWVYYVLGWSRLDDISKDSAVPGLDRNDAYDRLVPVPPPDEQAVIVRYLDAVDRGVRRYIRAKRRLIELLTEQKQAIIHHAVTQGLDPSAPRKPSGVAWLGDIPEHWEVVPVRRMIKFITSGSRGWARFYSDEGELFIQSGNLGRTLSLNLDRVQRVQVPEGAEGERTQIHKNDILVCVTGALTGNVVIVDEELPPAYVNQHVALVRPNPDSIVPRFLAFALHAPNGQAQFKLTEYGGTKQGLGLDDVRDVQIPVPSVLEQQHIVARLDCVLSETTDAVAKIYREIDLMREYRTRLIADVVTGKLDVREAALPAVLAAADDASPDDLAEDVTGADEPADDETAGLEDSPDHDDD